VSEDVLVKWSLFITESASRSKYVFDECVGDLAAEVRFLRDNLTERELQVRHLVRTHEQTVDNLVAQMDSLQTRVAELEADARLGRMVREIPEGYLIAHSRSDDEGVAWYYGFLVQCELEGFGPTPEAALEAARKGET